MKLTWWRKWRNAVHERRVAKAEAQGYDYADKQLAFANGEEAAVRRELYGESDGAFNLDPYDEAFDRGVRQRLHIHGPQ